MALPFRYIVVLGFEQKVLFSNKRHSATSQQNDAYSKLQIREIFSHDFPGRLEA